MDIFSYMVGKKQGGGSVDTEEVTVGTTESGDTYELDFSGGNVVVEPTAPGKVISKATILKPGTLAAENIRKNVEIGGIVGECDVIDYIETDILAEQTLTFSANDAFGGLYRTATDAFTLIPGESYTVVWDGAEFDATAVYYEALGGNGIGNAAILGVGEDNGQPFAIGDGANYGMVFASDTADTHTVRIFQEVRSDAEKVTVALSMADGNQVIVPSENGKVLTQVTVTKPDTLLPENIAEGIDIAGIIGTLVGGANVKVAVGGTNVGTSGPQTVNHNLGVVPDLIVLAHQGTTTSTKPRYGGGFGMSSKFYDTYCAGRGAPNRALIGINSNGQFHVDSDTIPMDKATSGTIYNVNATSFTVAQNILSCWFFAIAWLD